jgi:predicted permease
MSGLRVFLSRLGSLFRKERLDQELDAELRSHFEMLVEENLRKGMAPEEARRAARLRLGGSAQIQEEYREQRGLPLLETLWQDARYGLRIFAKKPGFTAIAVLTLALGIGPNAAIFSIVNAFLLRPLPFAHPERLTMVWEKDDDGSPGNTTYATFVDWQARSKSFESLALLRDWDPVLTAGGEPERIPGARVSASYFALLGVHPLIGRDFRPEDDSPSSAHVVIISYKLWQRRFGGNPDVLGKPVSFALYSYTIVGVMPQGFEDIVFANLRHPPEIWAPLAYDSSLPWACRTCHHLSAIGRLRPGVSFSQAGSEMNLISQALFQEHPKDYSVAGVILVPLQEQIVGPVKSTLGILLAAVGLVLLIACANVANLLLARSTDRQREIAIRTTIGASRSRIVRQLLTESGLLALLAGGLGLLLAFWTVRLVNVVASRSLPHLGPIQMDLRVLFFTLGISLLTGLLCGVAPAFHTSRMDLNRKLKESVRGTAGAPHRRTRDLLAMGELALALMLLIGAGLLLKSFTRLLQVQPGFEPQNLLTMKLSVVGQKYRDDANILRFLDEIMRRIKAVPGVTSAGLVNQIPLGGNKDMYGFHAEDHPLENPEAAPSAERYSVTPDYLETMRIPLLCGRGLTADDTATSPPVMLINQTTARQIWPNQDPIGKRVKSGGLNGPWRTVVGVVGDVRHYRLDEPPTLQSYFPNTQWPENVVVLAIRSSLNPEKLIPAVREQIWSVDKGQPGYEAARMEELVAATVSPRRLTLMLICIFAGLAAVIAAVGIYGAISYAVTQRTQEIGIRMALGAQPREIVRMVVGEGLRIALAGLALGLAGAFALARLIESLLFDVQPVDALTFTSVTAMLAAVALLAAYIPARRTARVDPMTALRYE